MFSEKDIKQIHSKGISFDQVKAQVKRLKNGMSYSDLVSAATIGKGIESFMLSSPHTHVIILSTPMPKPP